MKYTTFFVLMFIMLVAGLAIAQQPAPVKIESGLLQGTFEDGVTVYRGIPYAAPPVGELRWRPPLPPVPWKGVKKADKFSANPMQVMVHELGPWTAEYQPQGAVSEDCLYLNIWTAAKSSDEKRPVVMYIPGGAFTGGSGDVPVYNGEHLAKKGLVVVTINYRVGVIGFLALPELTKESEHHSSGNYGLLDQVAALKWIKKNISVFGGDPARVTIMGQSAGAASVNYLTASPLAKGLFIRAIAQSGSNARIGPGVNLKLAELNGQRFAKTMDAASLAELRAIPAAELIDSTTNKFRFLPIIDGWFLPKGVDEIFAAGEQSDVATITGWVADEKSFNNNYGKVPAGEFRKRVRQQSGAQADECLKLYPASTEAEGEESQKMLERDMSMVSMYLWAIKRNKTDKTKIYTYLFVHQQPGATKERYQTFHSSELPYVFDNLNQSPRPWTAEDKKIATTMSSYWVNFITKGDPNGNGLPMWPAFKAIPEETMELGDKMGPRPIAGNEKFQLLKKLLQGTVHWGLE
jgi:para-nitrobenzyl esterase